MPEISSDAVPEYLWRHLQHDVEGLAVALGKSVDESLLAIHLVLAEISTKCMLSKSGKKQCIIYKLSLKINTLNSLLECAVYRPAGYFTTSSIDMAYEYVLFPQ